MTRPRITTAIALSLAGLLGSACITETEGGVRQAQGMRTEGVIVAGSIDMVWGRTRGVIKSMATAPLESRGIERSVRTEVMGKQVTAFAEPYDQHRTIVHVQSEDPVLADKIRMRVMQQR